MQVFIRFKKEATEIGEGGFIMILSLITLAIVCVASLFGCIYLFCMADNELTKRIREKRDYSAVKYSVYLAFGIVLTLISFLSGAAIIIYLASLLAEGS